MRGVVRRRVVLGGVLRGWALLAVALMGACAPGGPDDARTPPDDTTPDGVENGPARGAAAVPADTSATVDTVSDWTAGIVDRPGGDPPTRVLAAVRVARHDGYDRLVFEFEGNSLPGYHLEYIDSPVRQCGSGRTVEIAGDGWLEVAFYPSAAHTEQGTPTVAERERTYELPVVRELELTCDFEARVVWVTGTASPNHFRVLELTNPHRLAVDLRH